MTKKTMEERFEEKWVDIIHEWHKDDPYPPIRPLVKKIVKELKANDKALKDKIRKVIKDAGPDIVCSTEGFREDYINKWKLLDLLQEGKDS